MSIIAVSIAARNLLRRRGLFGGGVSELGEGFTPADFLSGAFQGCHRTIIQAVEPLSEAEMSWRPYAGAGSAGFIVWHVARAQDALVHRQLLNKPEAWITQGWAQQFGLPIDETGQGYTEDQLATFQEPPKTELLDYLAATYRALQRAIDQLGPRGLDFSTERGMECVRYLVILTNHANMHAGAIHYIREILAASRGTPAEL